MHHSARPISSRSHLDRAKDHYSSDDLCRLFYAALELRLGIEARLHDYAERASEFRTLPRGTWRIKDLRKHVGHVFSANETPLVITFSDKAESKTVEAIGMSLTELKHEAERLTPAERRHLTAHLVALERQAEPGDPRLPEKLRAMEALWEDISRHPEQVESPAWHADVLRERERVGESAQAQFIDWERAKADIRRGLK